MRVRNEAEAGSLELVQDEPWEPAPAAVAGEQLPEASPLPARVLVADDDPIVRDMLSHHLEREGWKVECAVDGMQTTERLRVGGYDLLLLDLLMPYRSGFEILEWMRRRLPGPAPRTIMLTSAAQDSTVLRAFELGVDDFVAKPFNPMVVLARARRLVRRRW